MNKNDVNKALKVILKTASAIILTAAGVKMGQNAKKDFLGRQNNQINQ